MELDAAVALSLVSSLVAGTLAVVLLRTGPTRPANRRLAAVLALEATFLASQVVLHAAYDSGEAGHPRWLEVWTFTSIVGVSTAYLALLAILDTPLVRPFRARASQVALPAYALAMGLAGLVWGTPATMPDPPSVPQLVIGILAMATFVGVAAFALVATISAYRRAQPGSTARAHAGAFLAAFATRDTLWVLGLVLTFPFAAGSEAVSLVWWRYGAQVIVLVYVPILAYGILKTQLFDIDLKLKLGISRSTVATIALVVVLAAAKVAELYLNRTFGFIAGGIAAGVLLVLAPRLNKLGDRVAATALPKVQETPAYLQFRKLEVYKAALESALEGGEMTEKERATLQRLRAKLGIAEADGEAVEQDVRGRTPAI